MRIVQLADFDRPHAGSFVPMILGLMAEAKAQGHTCEVVLLESSRDIPWLSEFEEQGVPVAFAPYTSGSRVRLGRWLAGYLSDKPGPTVLHTHFTTWDVPACIAARRSDQAVFWHVHSALSRNPVVTARTGVKFVLFGRRVSGVLCPAPNIVDGARKRLSPRERTYFIPSSLDLEAFPLLSEERRLEARSELGIPVDAKVLLHFGWHWHLKGSDIFLQMLKLLADSDPSVIGVDRGGGEEMLALARELGLEDRFRLIPPVEDVRVVHGAADVMVSSSREEGMAYAVLESLASGTPVVATAIPGHAFLGDQIDACRLTTTDPEDLARAVGETLTRPPAQAHEEATAAHVWLEENLAHVPVAKRVIELYEEALPATTVAAPLVNQRRPERPRLIHLCDFSNPQPGSFVPMVSSVVEAARELGWNSEAIFSRPAETRDWHRELRSKDLAFRTSPGGSRVRLVRWARDLASESDAPTIVHTHFTRYDLPMALAATPGHLATVWHEHSALSNRPDVIARNIVKFRVAARRVEAILCPAPDLAQAMIKRGARADRVRFVPNAIDSQKFAVPTPEQIARSRERMAISREALVVMSFGWHWQIKGGELFQRAVADLAARTSREVVAIHTTSAPEAFRMRSELGLENTIRLVEQTGDVAGLMAAADVFVAASRAEGGTPLAVLEALSTGLPVVASDLPSHRYVAEHASGIAVVERDPRRVSTAILEATSGTEVERLNRGKASHDAVERHFSFERWCTALFETYDEVSARAFKDATMARPA